MVTILAQCDAGGLRARSADGRWLAVPPVADALVIIFGGLLAR